MFCTVDTESAFHVCLGPAQEQALEAALVDNGDALLDAFASIDVRTAKAGPDDTALIMGAIEQLPGGAAGLNELSMGQMRRWAFAKVTQMVSARRDPETGALLQQEKPLEEVNQLAVMLEHMGEVDAARKLYEEVIEGQTAQLGGSHTGTLTTKNNLALLVSNMGEVDAARKLYEEVIEGETAQLGGSHTGTLTTKGNLAWLLQNMG